MSLSYVRKVYRDGNLTSEETIEINLTDNARWFRWELIETRSDLLEAVNEWNKIESPNPSIIWHYYVV